VSRPLSTASTVTLHTPAAFTCHVGCAAVELESNSKTESKRTASSDLCVSVLSVLSSACEMFRRREQLSRGCYIFGSVRFTTHVKPVASVVVMKALTANFGYGSVS